MLNDKTCFVIAPIGEKGTPISEERLTMDLFKNLIVNLSATGPVAALCILAICIAAVGIWGNGFLASSAISGLIMLAFGLLYRPRHE